MVISEAGIQPKDNKIQDFIDAKEPSDPKLLRSFLGSATFFSNRIPNLSTDAAPLRELLKPGATYDWTSVHQKAFENIKSNIISNCLSHFDTARNTELWVDVGPDGTSAYIIQIDDIDKNKKYLVCCASRTFYQK